MIKKILWCTFLVFGALGLVCSPSFADTIGPTNCDTCLGNSYTLNIANEVVGSTTTSFDLFLTINSSGFNGFGAGNVGDVLGVAAKVTSNTSDIVSANLLAAPGGTGDWLQFIGGLNAGTCSSGSQGFICAQASFPNETDADTGGTLIWEWSVTVNNGTLLTSTLGSSVKAQFGCEDGTAENCTPQPLTSENITLQPGSPTPPPVPEPASMLLMGSGLVGLGGMLRRKLGNQAA
jgi:hypothetical protein